jgi:hypothetical protein
MILLLLSLLTAQSSPATPYSSLEQANQLACEVSDDECLNREFVLRKDADQAVRSASNVELGCPEENQSCLSAAWKKVDDDNFVRLRAIVTARGWPPLKGEAAQGAWLIAQHANPSPGSPSRAFRDLVLPMVRNEVSAGRLMPEDYARMVDRNALAQGDHQPFGTNRPCRDGRFDRRSIDTVDAVDQRRRAIGMDILLWESISLFDNLCEREASIATSPILAAPNRPPSP